MRDAVDEIRRAVDSQLVDEDGDPVSLELEPGLSPAEIDELERDVGAPFPGELRRVLEHTAGIDGALDILDFTGRGTSYGDEDVFPLAHAFAADGFGNHWLLDLTPEADDIAPVFYSCHDPPVVVFQSACLGDFVHEVVRMFEPPHVSLVNDVHDDAAFRVWGSNPGVLDRAAALAADDELRAFAESLDNRFAFVDLRRPEVGDGFSWGRFGPRTDVRRHGHARLFAYAEPQRKPGRLSRLLGR